MVIKLGLGVPKKLKIKRDLVNWELTLVTF